MYGCESWTVKTAKHRRIDAFELWCWRRLLRVPWIASRSNQSILNEISLGCSLEGLMLKLKLQYFGHLMRSVDSLGKTLMLGGIGGRRRRGRQRMRWLDGITDLMDVSWVNSGSWWWTEKPGVLQFMGSQRVGHDWATELNWCLCRTSLLVGLIRMWSGWDFRHSTFFAEVPWKLESRYFLLKPFQRSECHTYEGQEDRIWGFSFRIQTLPHLVLSTCPIPVCHARCLYVNLSYKVPLLC